MRNDGNAQKTSPTSNKVKTKPPANKPVQETDAKIRALEEQLAHLLEENQQTFILRANIDPRRAGELKGGQQ